MLKETSAYLLPSEPRLTQAGVFVSERRSAIALNERNIRPWKKQDDIGRKRFDVPIRGIRNDFKARSDTIRKNMR